MSVSDNSTVAAFRDNEGSFQMLDGYAYGAGDLVVNSYEKSPYADAQMVSLDVGPDATRFDIHGTVLCQSVELAAKVDPWGLKKQPVALPELDEAAAHTLVHYLYTGRYQALRTTAEHEKAGSFSYKLGTCVYCAAVRYKLPGLAELAKEKIMSFGEDVSISSILTMARDYAFPLLPEDEAWYPAYLEGAIDSAMAEDPEPFQKPDFITQVAGNSRLLQVVWKTVTSNFARAPAAKVVPSADASTPITEIVPDESNLVDAPEPEVVADDSKLVGARGLNTAVDYLKPEFVLEELNLFDAGQPQLSSQAQDAHNQGSETIQGLPTASIPIEINGFLEKRAEEPVAESEIRPEDSLGLDDIEPTIQTPQALERFTDELDFESSKMYRQMGKKSDIDPGIEITPEEPTKPVHSRTDSFMQIEKVSPMPGLEKEDDEPGEVADTSSQTATGSNEGTPILTGANISPTALKKNKKQKKKRSSIVFH